MQRPQTQLKNPGVFNERDTNDFVLYVSIRIAFFLQVILSKDFFRSSNVLRGLPGEGKLNSEILPIMSGLQEGMFTVDVYTAGGVKPAYNDIRLMA